MTSLARVVAVVPARLASSRFPNKPLASIRGLPMVEHVRRRAAIASTVGRVVVATCDVEIARSVRSAGGEIVMTADTHKRCTSRVEEASRGIEADVFVIVQGDEPLIRPEAIDEAVAPLLNGGLVDCTNLVTPLGPGDRTDPSVVKAALDRSGRILFLTRAPIPHEVERVDAPVYRQTGLIALRREVLERYADLPETPLERAESIDMLRFLEHGIAVQAVVSPYSSLGVDLPEHIGLAERALVDDDAQRSLDERIRTEVARSA